MAETVELATIWLVGLVGSTRLAAAVGPVHADSLREKYSADVAAVLHELRPHAEQARSELGWAEALAQRGELDRAREHASRALDVSRDHGYGAFERRAAAIVASHPAIR